jgi:hypothetical protein
MYTFYTPLDFLEYPQTGSAREDDLVPGVPGEPDGIQTPLSDSGDESETDESDTDTDEPDGTGNTTTCKHDSTLQRLICAGASSHLSHSLSLVVDDAGEITCTGSSRNYRPGQFLIINDSTNNTDDKHIVSIQCVGWGPGNWFLAIVQERTNEWTFKVEEAAVAEFVPKESKFHFILTLADQGLLRFQAIDGDKRYLAFGSDGKQVTVTAKDHDYQRKLFQTLFSASPVV